MKKAFNRLVYQTKAAFSELYATKKSTKDLILTTLVLAAVVVLVVAFVLGCLALGLAIGGLPLMLLWNWLMPTFFGLPEVTLLQTIGTVVLIRIILGIISSSLRRAS